MNFTAFAQGINQQRETDLRKRQELAQAFQQFKAQNPYASFDEYQSFIDNISGGRNYLRGGAPGREVLQSLASDSAKRKAQDELSRQAAAMRERAQLVGTLDAQIDRNLLDMEGDDYATAYQAFVDQFGPDMAPLFNDMDLSKRFNPQRRSRLIADQVTENLPRAMEIIEGMGGQGSAKELSSMLGIPLSIAEPLFQRAQQQAEQRQLEIDRQNTQWARQNRSYIFDQMDAAAERGVTAFDTVLSDLLTSENITLSPEVQKELITGYETQAARREEERQKALADRTSGFRATTRTAILQDPGFTDAILSGDLALASEIAESYLQDIPEDVRESVADNLVDTLIQSRTRSLQVAQDNQRQQRTDAINAQTVEQTRALRDANISRVQEHFGEPDRPTPNSGPAAGNAAMAAKDLSNIFHMTPAGMVVLQNAFADVPPETPRDELIAIGRAALTNAGVMPLDKAIDQGVQDFRRTMGAVEDDMTFEMWTGRTNDRIQQMQAGAEKDLSFALAQTSPTEKLNALNMALSYAKERLNRLTSSIQSDAKNQQQIITVGTGPWDNATASELARRAQEVTQAQVARIQQEIAKAEQEAQAARAALPADGGLPREVQSGTLAPGRSPAQDFFPGIADNARALSLFAQGADKLPKDNLLSQAFNSREEWARAEAVRQFINAEYGEGKTIRDKIMSDPQMLEAWARDPYEFYNSPAAKALRSQN